MGAVLIARTDDEGFAALAFVPAAFGPRHAVAPTGAASAEDVDLRMEIPTTIDTKLWKRLVDGGFGDLCGPRHEKPPYRAYTW